MLSVCVKVDVCYGPHMGAGGRAALSVWLCEKMVDSVSVLSLYINQLCHGTFDADGNGPCINWSRRYPLTAIEHMKCDQLDRATEDVMVFNFRCFHGNSHRDISRPKSQACSPMPQLMQLVFPLSGCSLDLSIEEALPEPHLRTYACERACVRRTERAAAPPLQVPSGAVNQPDEAVSHSRTACSRPSRREANVSQQRSPTPTLGGSLSPTHCRCWEEIDAGQSRHWSASPPPLPSTRNPFIP